MALLSLIWTICRFLWGGRSALSGGTVPRSQNTSCPTLFLDQIITRNVCRAWAAAAGCLLYKPLVRRTQMLLQRPPCSQSTQTAHRSRSWKLLPCLSRVVYIYRHSSHFFTVTQMISRLLLGYLGQDRLGLAYIISDHNFCIGTRSFVYVRFIRLLQTGAHHDDDMQVCDNTLQQNDQFALI